MLKKDTKRIYAIIKETFELLKSGWSPFYVMWNFIWWFSWGIKFIKLNKLASRKKQLYIERHIKRNYSNIVQKYLQRKESKEKCSDYKIWVFWAQGEENMPHIVRMCYEKLKQNNKNVQLIDMSNVRSFVQLPQTIYDKLQAGKLLYAHFSDILRNTLIAQYGGLWIDSTVWFPNEMPDFVRECTFFSPHNKNDGTNWCSYAIGSNCINSITPSFLRDILTAICINETIWPDYLFQDRAFDFAIKNIPAITESVDKTPDNNTKRFMLFALMNQPYDEDYYKELIFDNFIFKLSYKANYEQYSNGKPTYYAKVINTQ